MSRAAALMLMLAWSVSMQAGSAAAQPGPASEQSAPAPESGDGRFAFHRVGDGFVRLDSRTGQVAQCGWAATGWSCKAVPDERTALENEIARLQRDNVQLKQSLLSRGIELPGGMVAEAPAAAPVPPASVPDPSAKEPRMPSDLEVDRALSFMKNVWRKLIDMMADLQRDMQRKG